MVVEVFNQGALMTRWLIFIVLLKIYQILRTKNTNELTIIQRQGSGLV